MTKTMSIEKVIDLMEISPEGIGGLPATVYLPAACIPEVVPGAVRDAEAGVRLARMVMEQGWAECDRAEASGKSKAITKAQEAAAEAMVFWLSIELAFAALLIKRRIPLAGRSMIALKN